MPLCSKILQRALLLAVNFFLVTLNNVNVTIQSTEVDTKCNSNTFPACLPTTLRKEGDGFVWPSQSEIDIFAETLDGSVAQPGESAYKLYTFNARTHVPRPALIVFPASTADVQKAIFFAQNYGIRLSVSSTGK